MDKNKLFKAGKILGLVTAVSYAVYSKVKKKELQEEVIDITPEDTENQETLK